MIGFTDIIKHILLQPGNVDESKCLWIFLIDFQHFLLNTKLLPAYFMDWLRRYCKSQWPNQWIALLVFIFPVSKEVGVV